MKILALTLGPILACAPPAALSQTLPQMSPQVGPDDLLHMAAPGAAHKLAYGSDPLQYGELRVPEMAGTHPVAILVHGGCWEDRLAHLDPRATTYELLRPLAAALAGDGIATWNVEYRRAGSPGGGWPATFLDLAAAEDDLRKLAPEYHLDLHRVVIVGHSSGGTFAVWMAARPKLPATSPVYARNALPVKAVIDVDGPPDPIAAEAVEDRFCPAPGLKDLFGGTAQEQAARYRSGSAETYLPLGVPVQIVEGGLLPNVLDLVTRYQAEAMAKGDAVKVLPLDGAGHFDMLDPGNRYGKALRDAIASAVGAKPRSRQ